jgi:hypothetical protein
LRKVGKPPSRITPRLKPFWAAVMPRSDLFGAKSTCYSTI